MKRQLFYPGRIANQVIWLQNYSTSVGTIASTLGFSSTEIDATIADARWVAYCLGPWLTAVRAFSEASTQYIEITQTGISGGSDFNAPVFTAPAMPTTPAPAVVPVAAGALTRIFRFIQQIKEKPLYTTTMGETLQIIGAEDSADHPVPKYSLFVEQGTGSQIVRITFVKYTHMGVIIESKRGNGVWEMIGIDTESPYLDERPLLVAGVPEVREYRLRWWDKGTPNGDWTDIGKVTVAP